MTIAKTDTSALVDAKIDRAARAPKNSLKPEGHARQRHWHKAPPGATQDTVRHQDYWANLAPFLTRHDIITVIADDESWELEMCVERVLTNTAMISVRKAFKRETIAHAGRPVDDLGEFYSEFRAGHGWCIIRRKDSHPVIQGYALEANAVAQWQREQPRKVA